MTTQRPLLWFKFRDTKKRSWKVYLSSPRLTSFLKGLDGVCFRSSREIYVDAGLSLKEQKLCVLHEAGHALLADFTGDPRRISDAFEERAVTLLSENLFSFCELHGLRLPRRPRGYAALHKSAKVNEEE
jgi:hypothetical protein